MVDANQSALEIAGIPEKMLGINIFDNFPIASKKEDLVKEGLIKFQALLDYENIKNTDHYIPTKSGTTFIEWNVSVIDSGFLVQIQNINESEKMEELLQSEEKYHSFFMDDLTGDFIATPQGKIIECNPSFTEIYGFKNLEHALQSDISKFNPTDWVNLITILKNERKIHGYHVKHERPDGMQIHVVANVVGIFNNSNELIQVKGYVFDDTERKRAEESLQESEEKYHRLFDEDLTGDFIATPQGKIIECNPSFAGIYGFEDCETASKWNISQSNPFDWPYIITRLKSELKIHGFQSWQRRSDGMRIHVVANVVGIFNNSNELIQVKGYVFDDTERKRAEEELDRSKSQMNEILDSIQDGFIALTPYWNFIYVNKCAGDYFKVEPDDLIGQNMWEIFPELRGTTYETWFRKAMDTQEIQHFEASGMLTIDRWFDFSIYPSTEGISAYWRDITERKKLEKKLKPVRDHLKK